MASRCDAAPSSSSRSTAGAILSARHAGPMNSGTTRVSDTAWDTVKVFETNVKYLADTAVLSHFTF